MPQAPLPSPARSIRRAAVETLESRRLLATFAVDTLVDVVDAGDGVTSLREAIADAAANSEADVIDLTGLSGTITLNGGELDLGDDLTINGPGNNQLTLSGDGNSRVFDHNVGDVTIRDLTIADGNSLSIGGAIVSRDGSLTLENVIVRDSSATEDGGGIWSDTDLTIIDSIVRNNFVGDTGATDAGGGGIYVAGAGAFTMTGSTVANNQLIAASSTGIAIGAGVFIDGSTLNAAIANSTIDNNAASADFVSGPAIAISTDGPVTLLDLTITNNDATSNAGQGALTSGPAGGGAVGDKTFAGLLVVDNDVGSEPAIATFDDTDFSDSVVDKGVNIDGNVIADNTNGNRVGTVASPLTVAIGTLSDNGGPTLTIPLPAGSLAIGAGRDAAAVDQRNIPRDAEPDAGSFEFIAAPTDLTTSDPLTVAETASVGTVVATLSAVDGDPGDTFTFEAVGDPSPFEVTNTGEIRVAEPLDFETNESEDVTVRVTDAAGLSYDETFTLALTDVDPVATDGDQAGRVVIGGSGLITDTGDSIAVTLDSNDLPVVTINGESITLDADAEAVFLELGDGDDTITITSGGPAVILDAGGGNDIINVLGDEGDATSFLVINAGPGNDIINGTAGPDFLQGGDGDDTIFGNGGDDLLTGGNGTDSLTGGNGDDTLDGGLGDDVLRGNDGADTILYEDRTNDVTVDLADDLEAGEAGEVDVLTSIEYAIGGSGDDTFLGDEGRNYFIGNDGDDTLRGNDGKDTLEGGAGNDLLDGGIDFDLFDPGGALVGDTVLGGGGFDTLFADEDENLTIEFVEQRRFY
jgi:hypothetical protein